MKTDDQTTNHMIAPVLYKDCITDDFGSFAAGLGNNENLNYTIRLHIHHKRHWIDSSYRDIFVQGWDVLYTKKRPDGPLITLDLNGVLGECLSFIQEGKRLRQLFNENIRFLPNLRIISMAGIGENLFNGPRAWKHEELCDRRIKDCFKILPLALIDIPTVQHYCQAVGHGPLAAPGIIYQPQTPPQTFTHHPRGAPLFESHPATGQVLAFPIIVGSINRYYDELPCHIPYPWLPDSASQISLVLAPIKAMLMRSTKVADPVSGRPIDPKSNNEGKSDPFKDTLIEIYNCIRIVHRSNYDANDAQPIDPAIENRDLVPNDLGVCQRLLDDHLPEVWKGKVWLKNREEAPPRAACGFDIKEQFSAAIAQIKSWKDASSGK
jgi:hypothetical protein